MMMKKSPIFALSFAVLLAVSATIKVNRSGRGTIPTAEEKLPSVIPTMSKPMKAFSRCKNYLIVTMPFRPASMP
jgi:hypothetical protein